jgi:hypothetical protein
MRVGFLIPPKALSSATAPPKGYSPHGSPPGFPHRRMETASSRPPASTRSSVDAVRPEGPLGGHRVVAADAPGDIRIQERGGCPYSFAGEAARSAPIDVNSLGMHDRDLPEQPPLHLAPFFLVAVEAAKRQRAPADASEPYQARWRRQHLDGPYRQPAAEAKVALHFEHDGARQRRAGRDGVGQPPPCGGRQIGDGQWIERLGPGRGAG